VCETAAAKLRCWICGTPFYGRSDACYCSGACRQKAYRARTASETHDNADLREPDAAQRARQLRKRAQLARKAAAVTRRTAATLRDSPRQRLLSPTVPLAAGDCPATSGE
jgi:hypothetical protein